VGFVARPLGIREIIEMNPELLAGLIRFRGRGSAQRLGRWVL
jgi:hypothetical protein